MSRLLPAGQYDQAYIPHKLGNWEIPDSKKSQGPQIQNGTMRARTGKTAFIVDQKGYLLPGVKKLNNAFTHKPEVHQQSSSRWPQVNCSYSKASAATMGYKGIETDYLPSSTIPVRTVDIQGCKEFNFQ